MKRSKYLYLLVLVVLGFVILLTGRDDSGDKQPVKWDTVKAVRADMSLQVVGRGKVSPARLSRMWSRSSSRIQEIKVEEGQAVQTGDCLVKLEPDPQLDMEWYFNLDMAAKRRKLNKYLTSELPFSIFTMNKS